MKSSTYLNWSRRLVLLGTVAAVGAFASNAGAVGRPPDIRDAASGTSAAPDVFERYAAAHPFGVGQSATLATADVFERYMAQHPYGRRLPVSPTISAARPPDIQDTAAPINRMRSGPTRVSRPTDSSDTALAVQSSVIGRSQGFDWNDWGIGIGTGIGLAALLLGIAVVMSRQLRHRPRTA
jgi:hypothetical protein